MSVYFNDVPLWVWVVLIILFAIFGYLYFKKSASSNNILKNKGGDNINNGVIGNNNTVNNTIIFNSDEAKAPDYKKPQSKDNIKKGKPNWYEPNAGPRHKDYPKDKL